MTDRKKNHFIPERGRLTAIFLLLTLMLSLLGGIAQGEGIPEVLYEDAEYVIIEDDEFIEPKAEDHVYPPITSVGRGNVRVNGVISRHPLLEYTIPDELLQADPVFAALMMEADKYIGYPFVYGESNPKAGFDCSGFVSWVFIRSGVYNTGRRGATGLHTLCTEVDPEDVRPGDLVFFHGTMGPNVEGITHVGIYVGNQMMIHAGDPIGFADLEDEKWQKHFDCYGRLPIKEERDE